MPKEKKITFLPDPDFRKKVESVDFLLEQMGLGLWAFDRGLRIIYWNKTMEKFTGLHLAQVLGRKIIDIFSSIKDFRGIEGEDYFHQAINGIKISFQELSVTFSHIQGSKTFEGSFIPFSQEFDPFPSALAVFKELIPKKKTEQQLFESEKRFKKMADSAPVLLWMSETNSECSFFNQSWLDFTGRSLEEEIGVGWGEGIHFEDFQSSMDTYLAAFNRRMNFEMEYRLRRKDGEFRWILDRGTPRYGPEFEFSGYIGSCIDITERKTLEKARELLLEKIKLAEANFSDLYEEAPDMFATVEIPSTLILQCNKTMVDTLGFTPDEIIGKSLFQFCHPDYLQQTREALLNFSDKGEFGETEFLVSTKNGESLFVSFKVTPVRDPWGNIVQGRTVWRDITARKKMEEELRKAIDDREDFLSVASHELKTPITALKMQVQLLERIITKNREASPENLIPDMIKRIHFTERQVKKLTDLIESLLDATRIRGQRFSLNLMPLNFTSLVKNVVGRLNSEASIKGSTISFLNEERAIATMGDNSRLEQVVENLLSNAIKYGEGRPIEIHLDIFSSTSPGSPGEEGSIYLKIRDFGIGIPLEDHERIFRRFERAVPAQNYGGLGLGLYIARQIVESHQGSISVESSPGKGTTFTIIIPQNRTSLSEETRQNEIRGEE